MLQKSSYIPDNPQATAQALQEYWLGFDTNKGVELVKADQREQLKAVGIPTPVLKAIGNEVAKIARKDVGGFLSLARLLWDECGREGRVVALIMFGAMELVAPERLVPLLKELCASCVSWEDADRLAMDALEPIVRKHPDKWLGEIGMWLKDENKWVRRAAVTVIGRLPMKHPAYVAQCLDLTEQLLFDTDADVKKAFSFAVRICAKTDPKLVCAFLKMHIPPQDPVATWVLCDIIKSMGCKILPEFLPLRGHYEEWSSAPDVSDKDRRSIESAIKVLRA